MTPNLLQNVTTFFPFRAFMLKKALRFIARPTPFPPKARP